MRNLFRSKDTLHHPEQETTLLPEVTVRYAPNGINHHFLINPTDGSLTTTPHTESMGRDLDALYKYPAMDHATRVLYGAVRALDSQIRSVSVAPHKLTVQGPERANMRGGDWPKGLDSEIVDCIAVHMGWRDGATMRIEQQKEAELWREMDGIIIDGSNLGIEPPVGWYLGQYGGR